MMHNTVLIKDVLYEEDNFLFTIESYFMDLVGKKAS